MNEKGLETKRDTQTATVSSLRGDSKTIDASEALRDEPQERHRPGRSRRQWRRRRKGQSGRRKQMRREGDKLTGLLYRVPAKTSGAM